MALGSSTFPRFADPNKSVEATDADVASVLVHKMNNPTTSIVMPDFAAATRIDAPDDLVIDVANSVVGAEDYDFIPKAGLGKGVNANTVPAYIAKTAAKLAGSSFTLPDPEVLLYWVHTRGTRIKSLIVHVRKPHSRAGS